jgi:hypothetical protein
VLSQEEFHGLPNSCAKSFLTPWSRVLPEKLKRPKLLKKFPAFYGTRRFITAFTRTRLQMLHKGNVNPQILSGNKFSTTRFLFYLK